MTLIACSEGRYACQSDSFSVPFFAFTSLMVHWNTQVKSARVCRWTSPRYGAILWESPPRALRSAASTFSSFSIILLLDQVPGPGATKPFIMVNSVSPPSPPLAHYYDDDGNKFMIKRHPCHVKLMTRHRARFCVISLMIHNILFNFALIKIDLIGACSGKGALFLFNSFNKIFSSDVTWWNKTTQKAVLRWVVCVTYVNVCRF